MKPDPDTLQQARVRFTRYLSCAKSPEQVFAALFALSDTLVPVRLWTVMTVDLEQGLARRAYSNMPDAYPTSGTKPIVENAWFAIVHGQGECFVANTLTEIAAVFPDHGLIGALGCGSVLNIPIFEDGGLLATVNLLDVDGHFTPERVELCRDVLTDPSLAALLAARKLPQDVGDPKTDQR